MSHVQEINTLDELAGLRLKWRALLNETRAATFFQSLDWLEVYWRHFGEAHRQKLRVLVVESCDEVIGIMPLVVRPEATRFGRVRVLTYPINQWGTYYGPIGSNPTATLLSACGHIRRTARDWDLIDLRCVDRYGVDAGRTPRAMQAVGFHTRPEPWRQAAMIRLEGRWDDYWAARKSVTRNDYRSAEQRLAERGTVRFERHRPDGFGDFEPRWDLFEACVDVTSHSWQAPSWQASRGDSNTLSHADQLPFLRDAHEAAAASGALDVGVLWVDDSPVAFGYNLHQAGNVSSLMTDHDRDFSRDGAAAVLMGRMIRDSVDRHDSTIDLGVGSLDAKRPWLTDEVTTYRYSHFGSSTPRVQVLRMRRWMTRLSRQGDDRAVATAAS